MATQTLETRPKALLGIPRPQPVIYSPAYASIAEAESVYLEIARRLQAYSRSLATPLATPSVLAAGFWLEDRLNWMRARIASGRASSGEFDLAAQLLTAALETMSVFERWLVIDGGDPALLGSFWQAADALAAQIESSLAAPVAPVAPAANSVAAPLASFAAGEPNPNSPLPVEAKKTGGLGAIAALALVGVLFARRKR